ncbi:MAG: hypothetical protein QY318_00970 [Candidatus Dojkabacteria bacterium]|nr:MAG: hypothetical protein QY318_00970 [Candidatus Dojkabacteria bacterium]
MDKNLYVDNGKRGRLFFLAALLAVSLFVLRAWNVVDLNNYWHLAGMFFIYFFASYLGMIWGFRFQVTVRSLLTILPQSAIFVASQALFVMLFFFRDFARVYEFLLLFVLLIVVLVTTYISFLMANIFNVATFKRVPLEQVAKTTSYIITLLYVYFITFGVLSFEVHVIISVVVLFFAYLAGIFFHSLHLDYTRQEIYSSIIMISVSMTAILMGGVMLGSSYEITALLPTTVAFVLFGVEMNRGKLNSFSYLKYFITVLIAVAINIFLQ